MSALKCPQCGLVNFATAPACKRCQYVPTAQAQTEAAQSAPKQSTTNGAAASEPPPAQDYAPPPPSPDFNVNDYIRRDGQLLIMTEESVLPDRCIRCNAPAQEHLKQNLEWSPWYINMMRFSLWGRLLYMHKRKRATIYIGLCAGHLNRKRMGTLIGGGLVALGLFAGVVMAVNQDFWLLLFAVPAMLAGAFVLAVLAQTVSAQKIDEPYVWVKGVDQDFLASLPSV